MLRVDRILKLTNCLPIPRALPVIKTTSLFTDFLFGGTKNLKIDSRSACKTFFVIQSTLNMMFIFMNIISLLNCHSQFSRASIDSITMSVMKPNSPMVLTKPGTRFYYTTFELSQLQVFRC